MFKNIFGVIFIVLVASYFTEAKPTEGDLQNIPGNTIFLIYTSDFFAKKKYPQMCEIFSLGLS